MMEDVRMDVPEFHPKCLTWSFRVVVSSSQRFMKPPSQNRVSGKFSFRQINFSRRCLALVEEGTAFSGDEYASAIETLLQESDEHFAEFKAATQGVYRAPS